MVLFAEEDFHRYLDDLRELKDGFNVKVHAFYLMTSHLHLLASDEPVVGMGQMMKVLTARVTCYGNLRCNALVVTDQQCLRARQAVVAEAISAK